MTLPLLQTLAEVSVGRVMNTLPAGILIAFFAWALLRVLPRQNAGTKFAVWFFALLSVVALPGLGSFAATHPLFASNQERALLTIHSPWVLLIFGVWAIIAAASLLRLCHGLWNLRQLRKTCTDVDLTELDAAIRGTVEEFQTARSVRLATSEDVRVPAALGLWQPMIVLPSWTLRELPVEELRIILLHEFAHIQRRDDWTNLLQKTLRAMFFFHPAVWWIDRRLSLEREMACDDAVVAQTANPRGYAECLVALLEKSFARRGWSMAQAVVDRTRDAVARIAQILDHKRPATTHIWKPALGLVGAFSAISLATTLCAPQFVAFVPNQSPTASQSAHVAASENPYLPSSAVIPASFHNAAQPPVSHPLKNAAVRQAGPSRSIPKSIPVKAQAEPKNSVPLVRTVFDQPESIPAPRVLILLETEQWTDDSSMTWSLHVWRIMVIDPAQIRAAQAPAAKTT